MTVVDAARHVSLVRDLAGYTDARIRSLLRAATGEVSEILGYEHPNGFFKFRLPTASESSLCLHLWPPGTGDADVHNHRWDFASRVVVGSLRHTIVELAEGADTAMYDCRGDIDGSYTFRRAGLTSVRESGTDLQSAGEERLYAAEVFHAVESHRSEWTLSVVLQGPIRRHFSQVLQRPDMQVGRSIPPTALAQDVVSRYVETIRQTLETGD